MNKLLTNREHDELWRFAAKAIPSLEDDLRTANMLAIVKELYRMEALSDKAYTNFLIQIAARQGLNIELSKEKES